MAMKEQGRAMRVVRAVGHRLVVVCGALLLTLVFFLVLPVIQSITEPPDDANLTPDVSVAYEEPPEVIEEEEEEEPEEVVEEELPQLEEEVEPLDLAQLEMSLNATIGEGYTQGDFGVKLDNLVARAEEVESIFTEDDLDQKPRVTIQEGPRFTAELRRKAPATVYVLFIVDEMGRVVDPVVQRTTNPDFDRAALDAVKKWRFEPGERGGEPVRFRMRVPITFPRVN